jgi:hypothetical protein
MLLYVWATLSRYQNAAASSREYSERFPEVHHPGPRQLLIYSLFFLRTKRCGR